MKTSEAKRFQDEFWRRHPTAASVISLFDGLPQIYFFAKDRDSRFVKVNHLFLENHGLAHESQALGRSDRDFHPPAIAEAYIADDRRVMAGRRQLSGQVWPLLFRREFVRWYVLTKTPLYDPDGTAIGVVGAMYRIEQPNELGKQFQELLPVISHIERQFAHGISMAEMARLAGLSSTHFNRRFRQLLHMTPTEYLRTIRIQHSQELLTSTSLSLVEISSQLGFTDQSHFTRHFRRVTGMTPHAYRQRFVR